MRTVDRRQLNRTLLERQLLLRRRRKPALDVVEQLVGMQAQVPRDPYVGLWSRVTGFRPAELATAMEERRAVRMGLLRGTLHLVSDRDALRIRPVLDPVLYRVLHQQSPFGRAIAGVDVDELMTVATALLEEQPRTRAQLAPLLAKRWPSHDGPSMAYAIAYLLTLVQVTPRGIWGRSGPAAFTTLEHWLGRPPKRGRKPDELVRRYLAAFGPATPADVSAWSGLTGTAELLDRLRPQLRTYRDADGRELFDAPDGRLRNPDTPAPVRFLPEYDNALLSHADRSRIVGPEQRSWTDVGWGMVLVDGFTTARWKLNQKTKVLAIECFRKLTRPARAEVEDEAARLLVFIESPDAAIRLRG